MSQQDLPEDRSREGSTEAGSEASPVLKPEDRAPESGNQEIEARPYEISSPSSGENYKRSFNSPEFKAKATKLVTLYLLIFLSVMFAAHAGATVFAYVYRAGDGKTPWNAEEFLKAINEVFKVWLPAITGFMGSAIAFYFSQRNGE